MRVQVGNQIYSRSYHLQAHISYFVSVSVSLNFQPTQRRSALLLTAIILTLTVFLRRTDQNLEIRFALVDLACQ